MANRNSVSMKCSRRILSALLGAALLAELFLFVIETAVFSLLLLEYRERRAVLASALVNGIFPRSLCGFCLLSAYANGNAN